MARIDLDLAHAYKPNPQRDEDYALLPLKMTFEDGGAYALLGPSGVGKSTLLRVIAGLLTPDAGAVLLDDHDITTLPSHRRNIGLVFQDEQLFPHLSVGLKTIGLTARYMAFCISSEAAGLAEAEANFKNLATEITHVVDDLDAKTRAMKEAIEHGQELLELLLKGHTYAK